MKFFSKSAKMLFYLSAINEYVIYIYSHVPLNVAFKLLFIKIINYK